MPLSKLQESQLRSHAKEYIESLEFWLRVIIDRELREKYGQDYFNAKRENFDFLFNKSIRDEITTRVTAEPMRFPRRVDACVLETEIKIVTKPDLYTTFFKKYFDYSFPLGRDMVKYTLEKLIYPRNCLYHANPISTRDLEQIICYTNDIIDSIKKYYNENNMNQEFNVPKIIRIIDSFGNSFYREQFNPTDTSTGIIDLKKTEFLMYPGDKLKIEIEIDSSFPKESYKIRWGSAKGIPKFENTNIISFDIEKMHIGESLDIQCTIISNEEWHRFGDKDDFVLIWYKVLPRQ